MEINILQKEQIPAAVGIARGVFEFDLKRTIADQNLVRFFEEYVTEPNLMRMVEEKNVTVWGVYEAGQMCGVSAMQSEGHITMLYVFPFYRKRGFGKRLLTSMREYAKATYHLDTVTVCALPAWTHTYFVKNGFTPLATQVHPEYVNLEAKTLATTAYPIKKIKGKTLAIIILTTILFVILTVVAYFAFAVPTL